MKILKKTYEGPKTQEGMRELISKLEKEGWACSTISDCKGPIRATIYEIEQQYYLYSLNGNHSSTWRWERGKISQGKVEINIEKDKLERFLDNYQITERRCKEEK